MEQPQIDLHFQPLHRGCGRMRAQGTRVYRSSSRLVEKGLEFQANVFVRAKNQLPRRSYGARPTPAKEVA